jgi:hypothetical protein
MFVFHAEGEITNEDNFKSYHIEYLVVPFMQSHFYIL